ncbi:MAG TPA: methyltransferase domain-containing protein, partial [Thermoanaerobaculia bacterium]|nr:methyltransferase domain-containing protein [Thermoanaerobaculia bacterium]
SAKDAPGLLINFATMIQGLDLTPGLRLLDFGAGTGWTSRFLSQLGCEVIVLDVSPTALEIAKELYRRQPVIGDAPQPRFLLFDGLRIDLPDASVDRILCFDAFHHATNPDAMLREFARVLSPGGIAAFAEPGPDHSRRPPSQAEMRTYGVVENDVDIHAIWRTASSAGFSEIRLAAFHVPPFHVDLDRYVELLRGGESYLRWAESTRGFLKDVRNFFLRREGAVRADSRRADGLMAGLEVELPRTARAGEPIRARARVTNTGRATWLPSHVPVGGVSLGCHLFDANDQLLRFDHAWQPLGESAKEIAPGENVEVAFEIPALTPGRYSLQFDCVANRVAWFAQLGSTTVTLTIDVE